MLLIVGTIRLEPGSVAQALPAMKRMVECSRSEDGCGEYSYAEDVLDAGLIHVKEVWRDQKSLDSHFLSAHLAEWRAAWGGLGIRDRKLRVYEVGTGQAI